MASVAEVGFLGRRKEKAVREQVCLRYIETANGIADNLHVVSTLDERNRTLCRAALAASGQACSFFLETTGDAEIDAPLASKMLLAGQEPKRDAMARVIGALGWYFPLRLAASAPDRENQLVLDFLSTLHQGLHPFSSSVAVTDEFVIMELYERSTDLRRFGPGMWRWLARHLGDEDPDLGSPVEILLLTGALSECWPLFTGDL